MYYIKITGGEIQREYITGIAKGCKINLLDSSNNKLLDIILYLPSHNELMGVTQLPTNKKLILSEQNFILAMRSGGTHIKQQLLSITHKVIQL